MLVAAMAARVNRRLRTRIVRDRERVERRLCRVRVSIDIAARPEAAFALIADPRKRFVAANPLTRMEVASNQQGGAGTVSRWSFRLPIGGPRFGFWKVVTEW